MFLELTKKLFIGTTYFIQPKCKNVRKNRRDVVKWRNRNTSHLISAIEHRKRAFKTNPEMLFTKRIPIQCFGSLQTQTLDSNKKHLRSKHYSPRRAWVPTLWEPKYGKLQIPKLLSRQPSIVQFNLIHCVPN